MPASFVAISQTPSYLPRVVRLSAVSGRVLGAVAGLPTGTDLLSLQASASGSIWVTTATGPRFRNGTVGGDPLPDSCFTSIVAVPTRGPGRATVWHFPPSELVADAVASPTGQRVAFLDGPCLASFTDEHVVIRDRRGESQVVLGANAVACHLMSGPSWNATGTELTFTYARSALPGSPGPQIQGACPAWHLGELAVVSGERSVGVGGFKLLSAPPGCGYVAAAFDRWGIAAVETCGEAGLGPAYLEQLTPHLKLKSRLALEQGSDATWLSTAPGGGYVLIDEYQSPPESSRTGAWDWIWVFDGAHLRLIHKYPDFEYGLQDAAW